MFRNSEHCGFKCTYLPKCIHVSKDCIVPVAFKTSFLYMFPLSSHKNHTAVGKKEAELWSRSRAVSQQPVEHGWRCRRLAQQHHHLLDKPSGAAPAPLPAAHQFALIRGRHPFLPRHAQPSPGLQTSPSHPARHPRLPLPARPQRLRLHRFYLLVPRVQPGQSDSFPGNRSWKPQS